MQNKEVQITKGYLVLCFCYDLANEIALDKLEKVLGKKPVAEQLQLKRIAPEYIQYRAPPVRLKLGGRTVSVNARKLRFLVDVKLYDFGTVTVRYWLPLRTPVSRLKSFGSELVENKELEQDAQKIVDRLMADLKEYVVNPTTERKFESYAVYYIINFDRKIEAAELLRKHGPDIAAALCCEERRLSEQELQDSIKSPLSYYPDDLVIIDWNAAFVFDPSFSYESLDVIEYAVIELLELRTYDALLDKTLDHAYDDLAKHERHWLFDAHLHRIMHNLSSTRLEVVDVIDKVENSLKLFGDLYLVKVYAAAAARFGLENWKQSLKEKLDTVMSTYGMLSDKLESRRMLFLEAIIVALFIVDLIFLFMFG